MSYLLDTNVISELRKGPRANPGVQQWFSQVTDEDLFTSVLVVGELRKGIEKIRRRDVPAATALDTWIERVVHEYGDRILPVTMTVATVWGRMSATDPRPVIDTLLAATARVHGLQVVTRNTKDMARTGVSCVNPFRE